MKVKNILHIPEILSIIPMWTISFTDYTYIRYKMIKETKPYRHKHQYEALHSFSFTDYAKEEAIDCR
jgi:hypothetical protein